MCLHVAFSMFSLEKLEGNQGRRENVCTERADVLRWSKGQDEPLPSCCAHAMDHKPTRKGNMCTDLKSTHCAGVGGRHMVAMLDPPPPRVRASVGCANGGLRVIFILVVPEPFFSSAFNCSATVWNDVWSKATRGRQTHTLGTKRGSGHKLIGRYSNIG